MPVPVAPTPIAHGAATSASPPVDSWDADKSRRSWFPHTLVRIKSPSAVYEITALSESGASTVAACRCRVRRVGHLTEGSSLPGPRWLARRSGVPDSGSGDRRFESFLASDVPLAYAEAARSCVFAALPCWHAAARGVFKGQVLGLDRVRPGSQLADT